MENQNLKNKPMNYCKFIKCRKDPERITYETDYMGCGIAYSGESCYSLYSDDQPSSSRFIAYEIYLEEIRLNKK